MIPISESKKLNKTYMQDSVSIVTVFFNIEENYQCSKNIWNVIKVASLSRPNENNSEQCNALSP